MKKFLLFVILACGLSFGFADDGEAFNLELYTEAQFQFDGAAEENCDSYDFNQWFNYCNSSWSG